MKWICIKDFGEWWVVGGVYNENNLPHWCNYDSNVLTETANFLNDYRNNYFIPLAEYREKRIDEILND